MNDRKQARELIEAAGRGRLHPLRCCEAGSGGGRGRHPMIAHWNGADLLLPGTAAADRNIVHAHL